MRSQKWDHDYQLPAHAFYIGKQPELFLKSLYTDFHGKSKCYRTSPLKFSPLAFEIGHLTLMKSQTSLLSHADHGLGCTIWQLGQRGVVGWSGKWRAGVCNEATLKPVKNEVLWALGHMASALKDYWLFLFNYFFDSKTIVLQFNISGIRYVLIHDNALLLLTIRSTGYQCHAWILDLATEMYLELNEACGSWFSCVI